MFQMLKLFLAPSEPVHTYSVFSPVWFYLQRSGWWSSCPCPRCPGSSACPSRQGKRRS
uniref:Uncharacterized protein n=1 Tax=Poecilia mexicana TaxID=48701 RepID=A0A3B3X757_9TELE